MKIFLDFDDTIFNTSKFMKNLLRVFEKLEFSEKDFTNKYTETVKKNGSFNLFDIVELLYKIKPFDKNKIIKNLNCIVSEASDFLYEDFYDFVSHFKKNELILISFGNYKFQREKIENSGVADFFDKVIITQNSKVVDIKKISGKLRCEKIFFVDDKLKQINKVKTEIPKTVAIKIERRFEKCTKENLLLADYVVNNLYQAKKIISEI